MKELERWWRWVDNEHPSADAAMSKACSRLSDTERDALRAAAGFIACRKEGIRLSFVTAAGDLHQLRAVLLSQPTALRDMSFELCRSFERMVEQVSVEPAPKRSAADDTIDAMSYAMQQSRTTGEHNKLFTERYLPQRYPSPHSPPLFYLGGGYYVNAYTKQFVEPMRLSGLRMLKVDP